MVETDGTDHDQRQMETIDVLDNEMDSVPW